MKASLRWLVLLGLTGLLLQLFFVARIAAMRVVDPQSTAFQRSEAWRLASQTHTLRWRQKWLTYGQISDQLKRAVIASEDDGFINHDGIDWNALEQAWQKNAQAEQHRASAQARRARHARASGTKTQSQPVVAPVKPVKVVGGSTISQQLAKNLFLSGERTLLRKAQEFLLTLTLEALLSKQRILELYLNSVEWGEGVFGAEAAARRYYGISASELSAYQAARLAVLLPRPKYFEKLPNSNYVAARAELIVRRMQGTALP